MARGRPPDPKRQQRTTGNRPLPGMKVTTVAPVASFDTAPPASIPREAHDVWHAACEELLPRGLSAGDLPLLEMMVVAIHRNRQARAVIDANDILVRGAQGQAVVNPLLKLEKDTAATYLRLAETLGLSPAARTRLGLMQIAGQSILVNIAQTVRQAMGDK